MEDELEKISYNFDKLNDYTYFSKEQLVKIKPVRPRINFEECLITISKNGGMVGFLKKPKIFILDSMNPIKDRIRVFCQNGTNEHQIKFQTDKTGKSVVHFEFTNEEALYVIMNEGTVYKINIFAEKADCKMDGHINFKSDNIVAVQYFMKGYVALTEFGNFYIIKSFSDLAPSLFFSMLTFVHFEYVPTFTFLPPNVTQSKKIELFFPFLGDVERLSKDKKKELKKEIKKGLKQEKGHGIIKVVEEESRGIDGETMNITGVYYMNKFSFEPYHEGLGFSLQDNIDIGRIDLIVKSPNNKQIAFYKLDGTIFIFDSTIESEVNPPMKFDISQNKGFVEKKEVPNPKQNSKDKHEKEKHEEENVLTKKYFQFLFCGEDAICICKDKKVLLITMSGGNMVYKIQCRSSSSNSMLEPQFIYCISEIDGLRVMTNEAIFFIGPVNPDLYDSCKPFSEEPCKLLIKAYKAAKNRDINCDTLLRNIGPDLNKAVCTLQNAACNVNNNDLQLFLLKAANHGKFFLNKDDYNFDGFVEVCKNIRIINNLRESKIPRYLTYKEYQLLNPVSPKELIKRVMAMYDFNSAFNIAKYLDYDDVKTIYEKYAVEQIKNLSNTITKEGELEMFDVLDKKLSPINTISYLYLSKKAFKYGRMEIGRKFLEKEKSDLIKIPHYMDIRNWDDALRLAFGTYDSEVVNTVFEKLLSTNTIEDFVRILKGCDKFESLVVNYLKEYKYEDLIKYYTLKKSYDNLFFLYVEDYFKCNTYEEKGKNIVNAQDCLKNIENNKDKYLNFDVKYYKSYLSDLLAAIELKKELVKTSIIKKDDKDKFDNSLYDSMKMASNSLIEWKTFEKAIKKFDFSQKKINLIRLRAKSESGHVSDIISLYNNDFKKLGLSHLNFAECFLENDSNDRAAECIKKITERDLFQYKVEILQHIDKHQDALEVIISEKDIEIERKEQMVHQILGKRSDLKKKAEEFCAQYKVDIGL